MREQGAPTAISKQALQRMPYYIRFLREMEAEGLTVVAAPAVAARLGLNEVQVRKDLSAVSSSGRPKIGYAVRDLIHDIEQFLGYNNAEDAVLVGAGNLGKALLSYESFKDHGLNIVAAFDVDREVVGGKISGKPVYETSQIEHICRRLRIRMGILTVPSVAAQEACDALVRGGVRAIWNFTPTHLDVPDSVLVLNENLVSSIAVLSKRLNERLMEEEAL